MIFLDWLFGEDEELMARTDGTNNKFLDDDQLLFCCQHGLSTNKKNYTESELAAIKWKALQEKEKIKNKNRKKLYEVLNQ